MSTASRNMQGRVCVVTGANSGIGKVTARELADLGATVVMVCRSEERGRAALLEIERSAPKGPLSLELADMSSLASVRRAAEAIAARHPRIDVLVNNAGIYLPTRHESEDGFEMTFATNHLGPFLFTCLLSDALAAAGKARVVTVASEGHKGGRVNLDDLQSTKTYSGMRAYCTSKLMNILFARELSRREASRGIASNSVHPGAIASGFAQDEAGPFGFLVKLARPLLASPESGAKTQVYLAVSPNVDGVTGEYFARCKVKKPSAAARDDGLARALWERSAELAGVASSGRAHCF